MEVHEVRDSAFESVDAEDCRTESAVGNDADTSLDLLQQQQAKQEARLLHRFREMQQWQSQQQEQLMRQQQMQLEVLKGEQLRVQSMLALQRGAQWGDGREVGHKSPPLMTPPRRSGVGRELAKSVMAAVMPQLASTDSGLVASMGDTLEPPKGPGLRPVMVQTSHPMDDDDDNYTNPELFSNPGSLGDDLQAVDDRNPFNEAGSEVGSDNFYLPPLPPEPKESQDSLVASLNSLEALMGGKAPALLQQLLGQLPQQQRLRLLEQRQAAVQESASPTFSPVQAPPHHSLPAASSATGGPAMSASLPGFASSEAMFVPHTFTASFDQTDLGVLPPSQSQGLAQAQIQRPQAQYHGLAQIQRPQAQFQGFPQAQAPIQRPQFQRPPQDQAQRSQAQFAGPQAQAQFHRQQAQFPGPYQAQGPQQRPQGAFSGPSQGFSQGFLAQTAFPSSQNQRLAAPPFHSNSLAASGVSHPFPVPSDVQQSPYAEQLLQRQQQLHQKQLQQTQYPQQQHPATHKLSQQAELSKHASFQPQVNVRASWEDARDRGRNSVKDEPELDEEDLEEEEEEDSEELETTVKVVINPEDEPIRTGLQGRKTFEQLLEEQLADEEENRVKEEERKKAAERQKMGPVKRPFLRKGQGIARFSQPIKRPPLKRPSSQRSEISRSTTGLAGHRSEAASRSTNAGTRVGGSSLGADSDRSMAQGKGSAPPRRVVEKKRISGGRKKQEDEDPPQPEKLKLIKRRSETGRKTVEAPPRMGHKKKEQSGEFPSSQRPDSDDLDEKDSIADDASFVAGLKERAKKAPLEAEELDEFEALEDIADNMSLVSNSSVVQRLITPNKQRQKAAVTDLKSVVEKKRTAPSSPFERNTAMRSLLSINIPCPPIGQAQDPGQNMERPSEDNDDTLTEEDSASNLEADSDPGQVITARYLNAGHGELAETERENSERIQSLLPGNLFSQGQTWNGVDFSKQFSLFSQRELSSRTSSDNTPVSPQKSVTRKVATLQSRQNPNTDTTALLQKLSAHAGFLSSGFSQTEPEETCLKTARVEENDESGHDSSLLSSSVSRPQPVVIGGKKVDPYAAFGSNENNNHMESESDEHDSDATIEDDDSDGDGKARADARGGPAQQDSLSPPEVGEAAFNSNNNNNVNNNKSQEGGEDWEDEDEWTSTAPQAADTQVTAKAGSGGTGEATPPTSKLMSRLFPKLKPQPTAVQQQQQQKMEMAAATGVGDGIQSKVLREKLAELEAEIENFRTENAGLERLRREREDGLKKLKDEIVRFDQEKTDELRRLEEFKSQEMKKLKHERKLFETYQKQVRSMPDKKEREEIEALKRQLSDLQDEMKRKENRWTSSVTRLKTRVAELEGENMEMRDEMKMLERKRLEWMQSRPANKLSTSQTPAAAAVKSSTPRCSTPTNENAPHPTTVTITTTNGFQDNNLGPSRPPFLSHPPAGTSSAISRQANGAAAAETVGKSGSSGVAGGGHHNSSGGESMPRGEPATPSMIEGVSPAMLGSSEVNSSSLWVSRPPAPSSSSSSSSRAVDGPTIDRGNGQFEETQYADGKVSIALPPVVGLLDRNYPSVYRQREWPSG
ncbi:hypothetical protein ACOMHN_024950 [Nucella lapillus]